MAYKSDVDVKKVFCEKLLAEGYTKAEVKAKPSDIIAEKDGETWYYEMKLTDHEDTCFGAATLTEWEQAFKTPDRYRFVVAIRHDDVTYDFRVFTPQEFMKYSTIPPFKVYFNINLDGRPKRRKKGKSAAIPLTEETFLRMLSLFQQLKEQ